MKARDAIVAGTVVLGTGAVVGGIATLDNQPTSIERICLREQILVYEDTRERVVPDSIQLYRIVECPDSVG